MRILDGNTLTHGDTIKINGRRFSIGTTVGYAEKYGDNVAVAVARGTARGHALVWANPEAAVLTDRPIERDPVRGEYEIGEIIRIDRAEFRIVAAPNRNVDLVQP